MFSKLKNLFSKSHTVSQDEYNLLLEQYKNTVQFLIMAEMYLSGVILQECNGKVELDRTYIDILVKNESLSTFAMMQENNNVVLEVKDANQK